MENKISIMKRFLLIAVITCMGIFTATLAAVQSQSFEQVYSVDKNNTFSSTNKTTEKVSSQQNEFNNTTINDNSISGTSNMQQRIDPPGDPGSTPVNTPVGDGGLHVFLICVLAYIVLRFMKNKLQTDVN